LFLKCRHCIWWKEGCQEEGWRGAGERGVLLCAGHQHWNLVS